MAEEQSVTLQEAKPVVHPNDPSIVNLTGEIGPDSNVDLGVYLPVKDPTLDKKRKRKEPKKTSETSNKKARKNLTLELSKPEFLQGTVRFDDIREVKHDVYGKRQTAGRRLSLAVCRFEFLHLSFAYIR